MTTQIDQKLDVTEALSGHDTRPSLTLPVLFSITAFVGAGLLFVVQPLIARLLLPSYGGSATVWSTSSLFFQCLLLASYAYVHWSTRAFRERWQPRLHLPLLGLAALSLPIALPAAAAPSADVEPAVWLLRTLVLMVGLPFAVVATTGPVLQRWYSWAAGWRSDDPYFLFAASNLGSFAGLLAYPFAVEPLLSLEAQRRAWSFGFIVFACLTASCAVAATRRQNPEEAGRPVRLMTVARVDKRSGLRWVALAFVPSSLMLGVTAHVSTDVAAIPLLWVVPLAIYLATFVVAFRGSARVAPVGATRLAVAASFVLLMSPRAAGPASAGVLVVVSMSGLAIIAFAAHARLAAERPPVERLTSFYLFIALGGALGGLLNGLLAPVVFDRVLEYPVLLASVPMLMWGMPQLRPDWLGRQSRANRVRAVVLALSVLAGGLGFLLLREMVGDSLMATVLLACALAGYGWCIARRFVLAVAVGLLVVALINVGLSGTIDRMRSFFGSYRVVESSGSHRFVHGTTIHGTQFLARGRRTIPTTYYSRSGPLGGLFDTLPAEKDERVAIVGLGTGTIAAHGRPGQAMTFFEIDPEIVDLAKNPRLFSYLADSRADVETVVGDGRLRVAEYPRRSFDVIVLDAFSSDSIPVHLLTREAMRLYASRLSEDGVIMVHISNRVFDLRPVLASTAAGLGWQAALGDEEGRDPGATRSQWVALSADTDLIAHLAAQPDWTALEPSTAVVWTDDYSSILSVMR